MKLAVIAMWIMGDLATHFGEVTGGLASLMIFLLSRLFDRFAAISSELWVDNDVLRRSAQAMGNVAVAENQFMKKANVDRRPLKMRRNGKKSETIIVAHGTRYWVECD